MTKRRIVWTMAAALVAAVVARAPLAAQGVTTAAVAGRVLDESGAAVPAAQLVLTNSSTGERYSTTSRDDGRYSFETVNVGGPYTLQVRALGFEPKTSSAFMLTLGQRFVLDVAMRRTAVQIAGVSVTAQANPLVSPERTGAQTFVSDTILRRLPTLNRSFNDFLSTAPQVVGRSFTGQNDRFNNIQIDGTENNDLFNLGSSNGTPGGGVSARPISIEAVREYQVLVAPFDVRQGGFVGGLVNAVTQSGTNEFHGAVFGYMQNENFVGSDTNGVSVPVPTYQQQQFGFSLGGPIIRDRLHFFVTGDFRHDVRPFATQLQIGPDPTNPADTAGVGITIARADSVQSILKNQYGFDPGSWRAPDINNPETNLFGKLDYELGTNSHLEISGIFVNANQDKLIHQYTFPFNSRDGYELSNSGYSLENKTRTVRGKWTATFGQSLANEAIVGYSHINDLRPPASPFPLILVAGNSPNTYLAAGAENFSQANSLDQKVFEVTDNLTFPMGQHRVTVGTHDEFIHFRNVFFPSSIGIWNFASPESLATGTPDRFQRALPTAARPDGPVADFNVSQIGFYAEDQFSPVANLLLTIGLRADVPSLPSPAINPTLDTIHFPELGGGVVNTGNSPTGNILWSPRLGFNYDLHGDQTTIFRGGVGIFSGRPPYVWVSNAFGNTGQEQATLLCTTAATIPTFTVNPDSQPTTCAGGGGPTSSATSIVFYDPSFKFPQALKLALGFDRQLPWGMLGTVDFIYTKSINQFYLQDVNLKGQTGTLAAEGGRVMYGTPNTTTGAVPVQRFTTAAADVVENVNRNADKSTSLTLQLQKRFSDNLEFRAAYTYSHSLDLISMTSDITSSNYRFAALDGSVENRNLRTSAFDRPHKITISGTVNVPFDVRFSLVYNGVSGTPYTYVVAQDVNGDGVGGNDDVYVPRDNNDISMVNPADTVALDRYINGEPCLRENRGRILPRNSCRNSWINTLNARLSKVIPTVNGQSVEIDLDVLNVLNLLNSGWGLIRQTGVFEETNLLRVGGWDATNNRFKYNLSLPKQNVTQVNSIGSRWVMQLGVRYAF